MLHLRLKHDQHLAEISQVTIGLDTRIYWQEALIDHKTIYPIPQLYLGAQNLLHITFSEYLLHY